MAHESFEDSGVAELLNRDFVSIKVDREERPDLDQVYMEAVQAMTGQGGWPMSVFLTPQQKPFFGGTYWPRAGAGRHGRALATWLRRWPPRGATAATTCCGRRNRPCSISSHRVLLGEQVGRVDAAPLETAEASLLRRSIDRYGGFGPRPKFPHATELKLLLARWRARGKNRCWRWSPPRSTAWPPAASTTISAAASTAIASTPNGSCRISRKCSTTTPCWPTAI